MENDAPVIYGLEFQVSRCYTLESDVLQCYPCQGRTLAARAAETDEIHFLVGTQSLKAENQVFSKGGLGLVEMCLCVWVVVAKIHLLQFDDESNYVEKVVFLHSKGEVW